MSGIVDVMYADSNAQGIVLIIQAFIFLLAWFTLYRELATKYKEQQDSTS